LAFAAILHFHSSFFIRLSAAEPTREQLEFFENKIRPVLSQNCYKCHSVNSEKVKGGLLLDSREATCGAATTARPSCPAIRTRVC
jgi:hypothetical protein